jgi:hypothetical protein
MKKPSTHQAERTACKKVEQVVHPSVSPNHHILYVTHSTFAALPDLRAEERAHLLRSGWTSVRRVLAAEEEPLQLQ